MTYELEFDPRALKEWRKLEASICKQFKKKLSAILIMPRIESNRVHGLQDCYKIKLRSSVFRLIYQVEDEKLTVFVIAIGKREKLEAYNQAEKRLS